ncbi:hypothetical protein [Inhella crocodyli]|uniref:DUF3617 family protein n=1 Tax=Inhella crocodyli TaxID=2499851 RepID=A0A3S2UYP2_9BURK|nr:hypothetical protein [Inhella crocodyli]RVT83855.1 hypothetical protein EOD73_14940 [Inhella crocodyli]
MKRSLILALTALCLGSAQAAVPLFAAKCGASLNVDTNPKGQVYMNGKVAKLIKRPDGQISANSAGAWVDITPNGGQEPRVTYTARDKSVGTCEILSFKAPDSALNTSAARAGQGQSDARTIVNCKMQPQGPMQQCNASVTREGNGSATVMVTRPDGRTRAIFFDKGRPLSADLSQADGSMHFKGSKRGDMFHIEAGNERYEFPEAVVFGG